MLAGHVLAMNVGRAPEPFEKARTMKKLLIALLGVVLTAPLSAAPNIKVGDSEVSALQNGGNVIGKLLKGNTRVYIFEEGQVTVVNGKVNQIDWKGGESEVQPLDGLIPDPGLDKAVRWQLGKQAGEITREDLASLVRLEVSAKTKGSRKVETLEGLQYATNLTQLELSYNAITNISQLSELTQMRELKFHGGQGKIGVFGPATDFTPLRGLTNMTSLYLSYHEIYDLWAFTAMPKLQEMVVVDCALNTLRGLPDLNPSLRKLVLSGNDLSDISELSEMKNVHTLWLDVNRIGDLSPLSGMESLRTLKFDRNQVRNLQPLNEVPVLTSVSANNNGIGSLEGLRNNKTISSLLLRENQITDITPLTTMASLVSVNLERNNIDIREGARGLLQIQGLAARGVAVRYQPQGASFNEPPLNAAIPPGQ